MLQNFLTLNDEKNQHNELHRKIFNFAQGCIEKKFTTVPTATEIPVGYFAYYEHPTTGVTKIYVNFFGLMKSWTIS